MTKERKRGVPFREIRVKLGRQIPPWKRVKEKVRLNENLSKKDMYLFRGFYTTQIHILLRRPDLAERTFEKLEKKGFTEEFEEEHASRLDQISRLVRKGDI